MDMKYTAIMYLHSRLNAEGIAHKFSPRAEGYQIVVEKTEDLYFSAIETPYSYGGDEDLIEYWVPELAGEDVDPVGYATPDETFAAIKRFIAGDYSEWTHGATPDED